jgi:hypothetical protein
LIKLMVGVVIIACIAPLFIKGSNGEPLMTLDDWKIDVPVQLKGLVGNLTSGVKMSPPVQEQPTTLVYKWQDDEEQWHFSNAPPNLEIAEEVEISDVNLIEAYVPPVPRSDAGESADSESMGVPSGMPEPEQFQKMKATIEQFQQTIDQKKEALDSLSAQQH